ncbi:MAG TPA: ABC transporter permease [Anaerolineae bacterium]|nr:ABC transporter permease [Anaerolineae bacterium]HMR66824.1 ABC transporter permease [Anaerolineae bacterium]
MILVAGFDPVETYLTLLKAAFGSPRGIGVTITNATPLLLAGLAVAIPFRCGLLNIGGEGQIYIGGLTATLAALYLPGLPFLLHLPLTLLAGFSGGALWGAIPGWLLAARKLNEVITTIMMNFIGFWLVSFLVHGPLKDPDSFGYAWTAEVPISAQIPLVFRTARINLGIALALICALLAYFLLWRTTLGYEMRAVAAQAQTARFAGIHVERTMILAMLIGGGLAGLAGAAVILGVQLRLSDFFSPGYGFTAIAVALVGRSSPLGVVLAALFFGALENGAGSIERSLGIPQGVASSIQGITLVFILASQSLTIAHWLQKRRTVQLAEHH